MNKNSRNIVIIIVVATVLVAVGVLAYFFRNRLFTAVGTSQIPGLDLVWQVELNGNNPANGDNGDAITANRGDLINFTVNYSENDPSGQLPTQAGFQGAVLFVPLDGAPELAGVTGISGGGLIAADPYNPSRNGIVWNLGDLDIPASGTESFSATVDPSLVPPATINLSAEFRGIEFTPPAVSNMTITLQQVQVPPGGTPNLSMVKNVEDVNGAPVERGDLLKYTLTLSNSGNATATGIKVVEDIPAKLEQFSVPVIGKPAGAVDNSTATGGANGTGYLDVNSFSVLPAGSTSIVYTVVVANSATDKEQIDNVATATYAQSPNSLQASAQVVISVSAGPVVIPDQPPVDTQPNPTPTSTPDSTPLSQAPTATTSPSSTASSTNTSTSSTTASGAKVATTPTQAVVVPQVGVDPSLIALGGSGVTSVLVGAGYYLSRKRKKK